MNQKTGQKDAVLMLVENLVNIQYDDLSVEDIDVTKRFILDTLGTLAAGSPELPFEQMVAYLKEEGGKKESTIMIYGGKVPARAAVLINSSMARAIDLDEVHEELSHHTCVSVVPAVFAMAERRGRVHGKELITAVALGFDLMSRLRIACNVLPTVHGRASSYVFGTFGAAAVAAKLLKLDVDGTISALGNAYCQAAGDTACYNDAALSQRVHQGSSASAGILAALLAANGVQGSRNFLEGSVGYYTVHEDGEYTASLLTENLGKKFWGTTTSFKPYPNSKGIHIPMEAALGAVLENDIKPDEIERISIRYPAWMEGGVNSIGYYKPERVDPKGSVEAHFSVPWGVGVIVAKRKAEVEDFSEEGVNKIRGVVVPIARTVVGVADTGLERIPGTALGPCIAEITTNDGKVHTKREDYCSGSPQKPFTWQDMTDRFREFTSLAAKSLPKEKVEHIINLVRDLENVEDATKIAELMG
ncbi:MmgE/PrpD family protein [Chloroflexota bacterium]